MELGIFLTQLLVAIGVGGLIGLEREKVGKEAGFRTFIFISVFGLLCAIMNVPALGLAGIILFGIASMFILGKKGHIGETTTVVEFLVFILGYLVGKNEILASGALSVIIAIILASKKQMHDLAKGMSGDELDNILKLGLLSVIVLPILPTAPFDPLGVLSPFTIWLFVIFIFGISVLGYIALKRVDPRHEATVVGLGGLVSSTATSIALLSKGGPENAYGVILADASMLARVIIITLVLSPTLFARITPFVLVSIALAVVYSLPQVKKPSRIEIKSPITLTNAIILGVLIASLLVIAETTLKSLGIVGMKLMISGLSLVSMDAALLTVIPLHTQLAFGILVAKDIIITACLLNTLVKLVLAYIFNRKSMRIIGKGVALMALPLVVSYFL